VLPRPHNDQSHRGGPFIRHILLARSWLCGLVALLYKVERHDDADVEAQPHLSLDICRPPYIQMTTPPEKESSVPNSDKGVILQNAPSTVVQTQVVDEESQLPRVDQPNLNSTASDQDEFGYRDNSKVPKLSYLKLFWFFFYNFGLFAWGGPVAQIALIKERLVRQQKYACSSAVCQQGGLVASLLVSPLCFQASS
jgi:hypothetical protein